MLFPASTFGRRRNKYRRRYKTYRFGKYHRYHLTKKGKPSRLKSGRVHGLNVANAVSRMFKRGSIL